MRRGRARHHTVQYPRLKRNPKARRASSAMVAFFSMLHAFLSSLEGAEAARERRTSTQPRLSMILPSYVGRRSDGVTSPQAAGVQSFAAGGTVGGSTMARTHCRSKLSSFNSRRSRRSRSTASGRYHRSVGHVQATFLWPGKNCIGLRSGRSHYVPRGRLVIMRWRWRAVDVVGGRLRTSSVVDMVCPLSLRPCLLCCRFPTVAS